MKLKTVTPEMVIAEFEKEGLSVSREEAEALIIFDRLRHKKEQKVQGAEKEFEKMRERMGELIPSVEERVEKITLFRIKF